jgi:hypothetical protein
MKCHYCDNESSKTLVWLKDKSGRAARIKLPWCGCDLMASLKKIWSHPYQVHEGRDYEVLQEDVKEHILDITPEQLRAVAKCLDSRESDEIERIANEVERNGAYTVMRPAYQVTWRDPNRETAKLE